MFIIKFKDGTQTKTVGVRNSMFNSFLFFYIGNEEYYCPYEDIDKIVRYFE